MNETILSLKNANAVRSFKIVWQIFQFISKIIVVCLLEVLILTFVCNFVSGNIFGVGGRFCWHNWWILLRFVQQHYVQQSTHFSSDLCTFIPHILITFPAAYDHAINIHHYRMCWDIQMKHLSHEIYIAFSDNIRSCFFLSFFKNLHIGIKVPQKIVEIRCLWMERNVKEMSICV